MYVFLSSDSIVAMLVIRAQRLVVVLTTLIHCALMGPMWWGMEER